MKELEQTVKLFDDSEKTGKQYVTVDVEDKWICVTHNGDCLSMTIENWLKLVSLANTLLAQTDSSNV